MDADVGDVVGVCDIVIVELRKRLNEAVRSDVGDCEEVIRAEML